MLNAELRPERAGWLARWLAGGLAAQYPLSLSRQHSLSRVNLSFPCNYHDPSVTANVMVVVSSGSFNTFSAASQWCLQLASVCMCDLASLISEAECLPVPQLPLLLLLVRLRACRPCTGWTLQRPTPTPTLFSPTRLGVFIVMTMVHRVRHQLTVCVRAMIISGSCLISGSGCGCR